MDFVKTVCLFVGKYSTLGGIRINVRDAMMLNRLLLLRKMVLLLQYVPNAMCGNFQVLKNHN